MPNPILTDQNQFPSQEVIFAHLGKAKPLWISLFEFIHSSHPDFTEEWRYYRDGKSWLLKVMQKKKTIFWLSLIKDGFGTTFYFTARAEEALMSSNLSEELKQQFRTGIRERRINGVTVVYGKKRDVENAKVLIDIKLRMK